MNLFQLREHQIFLNPKLPKDQQSLVRQSIKSQKQMSPHFWLMSSGTESSRPGWHKMIALSPEALLTAGESVVKTFSITSEDRVLSSLPLFHVGGLSQLARAQVSGCKMVAGLAFGSWDPQAFLKIFKKESLQIVSLVPTQIYDLVNLQSPAPQSLRMVFVGGGALDQTLFERGRELGWPFVLTYGMTETSAMLCHSSAPDEGGKRFPHILDWKTDEDGRLSFLSPSLLSTYLFVNQQTGEWELQDPKEQGWYRSDDVGEIREDRLFLKGRSSELVKVLGETVSLKALEEKWSAWSQMQGLQITGNWAFVALPHDRKGFDLIAVFENPPDREIFTRFLQTLLPFERLSEVRKVEAIPLTSLGKIRRQELVKSLQ